MADLGKVVVTDGGNYSASVTYEKLTFVHYLGDAYMTLKTVKGITPTDDGVNYRLFCKSAELATASKAGIVMPDGTTMTVDSNGKMSAKKATASAAGIVKPADTDFTVASDGTQKLKTSFTQAATLANIVANEAWLTMLGKIAKAIASLMDLSSKALMKAAMSGIDANDANKVPTSAFIHTLVDRIGMGTSMTSGYTNLTAAVNGVKQGLDEANSNLIEVKSNFAYEYNGKDLNVITHNCIGFGNTVQVKNCKNTGYGAIFEVRRYSDSYIVQIQRDITSGGVATYKRCKSNNTWTSWEKDFDYSDLTKNVSSRMATGSVLVNGNFNQIRIQVETYSGSKVLAVYDATTNTIIGNIPIP